MASPSQGLSKEDRIKRVDEFAKNRPVPSVKPNGSVKYVAASQFPQKLIKKQTKKKTVAKRYATK
jgi:hypothetical protein